MNNDYSPPKKRHNSSFDSDIPPFGLPRKKFISEESFAKDMAAMSLEAQHNNNNTFAQQNTSSDTSLDEDEEDEEEEESNIMVLDSSDKPIIDVDQNGLPMELRPGENKLRIPQFVLENPELLDPRDKLAYHNMLKSLQHKKEVKIEVLNNPYDHYTPTSMDID